MDTIALDATRKPLGRLASTAAFMLQGKTTPSFDRSKLPQVRVRIDNLSKAYIPLKKLDAKLYYHSTARPGGLKIATLRQRWEKNPQSLFSDIVSRMLPKNKSRKRILKNLDIHL